jgi:hypothetical protein
MASYKVALKPSVEKDPRPSTKFIVERVLNYIETPILPQATVEKIVPSARCCQGFLRQEFPQKW